LVFRRRALPIGATVGLGGTSFRKNSDCSRAADTEVRFENGDTPEGRRAYASMLMAMQTGTTVTVSISGCTNQGSMSCSTTGSTRAETTRHGWRRRAAPAHSGFFVQKNSHTDLGLP